MMKNTSRSVYLRTERTFKWEMAHLLPDHPGLCRFIHGHSYLLDVEVGGYMKTKGPEKDMVIDFGTLDKIVQKHVIDVLDHSWAVQRNFLKLIPDTFRKDHTRLVVLNQIPTCEAILLLIKDRLTPHLPGEIILESLMLQETGRSRARWVRDS